MEKLSHSESEEYEDVPDSSGEEALPPRSPDHFEASASVTTPVVSKKKISKSSKKKKLARKIDKSEKSEKTDNSTVTPRPPANSQSTILRQTMPPD